MRWELRSPNTFLPDQFCSLWLGLIGLTSCRSKGAKGLIILCGRILGHCLKTSFAKVQVRVRGMLWELWYVSLEYEREPNYKIFESYGYDNHRWNCGPIISNVDCYECYLTAYWHSGVQVDLSITTFALLAIVQPSRRGGLLHRRSSIEYQLRRAVFVVLNCYLHSFGWQVWSRPWVP